MLPLLSRHFRVYAPDMPGFGRTPMAQGTQNIALYASYLERFIDSLGHQQIILVGQSLGGWITTRHTLNHPNRIKHLYLLNSAGLIRDSFYSPYAPDRESARAFLQHVSGYSGPIPNFVLDTIIRESQSPAYKAFVENYEKDRSEELDELLPTINTPTTIIWGTKDRIFPLEHAHDFHKNIPNSRLVLLHGVSHSSQTEGGWRAAKIIREEAKENNTEIGMVY
jgi:pimeloyl-ACP methyl ester carboxylesterase